jgi:hypothetical protein
MKTCGSIGNLWKYAGKVSYLAAICMWVRADDRTIYI